eukprot:4212191-Alexandrium_andersonii.AAC.1
MAAARALRHPDARRLEAMVEAATVAEGCSCSEYSGVAPQAYVLERQGRWVAAGAAGVVAKAVGQSAPDLGP